MGRLRIPHLVDLVRTEEPAAIRAFAQDKRLDRAFTGSGGLINRIVTGKVRRVLALEGVPLPSVKPRGDAGREHTQNDLQAKLDQVATAVDADSVAAIAKAVRGLKDALPLEHAVQQAVGRLFAADYQASADSWNAALLLDQAAHSMNPIASLWWSMSGKLAAAQRLLGKLVHDDRAGVHATGIAVHNLVRGFKLMHSLFAFPNTPDPAAGESVVARCVQAPESVLREAIPEAPGAGVGGAGGAGAGGGGGIGGAAAGGGGGAATDTIRPGTLVVLDLAKAQQREDSPEIVFMAGSWSHCPAAAWVPALIRAVWKEALQLPAPAIEPVGGVFRREFTQSEAAHRWTEYRRLLGLNLALQLAFAIVLLAAPEWVAHLFGISAGAAPMRVWGLLIVVLTALYGAGWFDPVYTRWPNVVGIAGRGVTALLYLTLWGGFIWFALFDAAFAIALAASYARGLGAELMSRP
jgi:hypothetical protein